MNIKVRHFSAGACTQIMKLALRSAPWRCCQFPARFSLIQHPTLGNILFDTGYTDRFISATQHFPFQLYRWLTPLHYNKDDSAAMQLKKIGIAPNAIHYIFISHFHADHIAGLRDFSHAQFIYSGYAYRHLLKLGKVGALRAGFLQQLLPVDFLQRGITIEDCHSTRLPSSLHPFKQGYQILPTDSLCAIPLPGHAPGHFGLYIHMNAESDMFLIGDACWHSAAYREYTLPHWLTSLIMENKADYADTLAKLNQLYLHNPNITIIPSHCTELVSNCAHATEEAASISEALR